MSFDRLGEIMERLHAKHFDGKQLSREEYEEQQCANANKNIGNLNEIDGYNCPVCKNKGVVYVLQENPHGNGREIWARDCKCMSIRQTLRRAKESGLGNVLTDYTFDKYIVSEEWQRVVKEKAQDFCKNDAAKCFYIGGQTGAGKSHICTAIAAHYIKAGFNCYYMLWRDDAVKLKAAVNDREEYQKLIDRLKNVDVLYIDDFLKVKEGTDPTTADINLAFEILNFRLLDIKKITIISSEFTITRALEFDEATLGRVYLQSGDYKISIDRDIKKNYRLKG